MAEPNPNDDASFLFRNAREDIKKLQQDSKKLLRGVKRAEWWEQHGLNRPKPNQTPEPPLQ